MKQKLLYALCTAYIGLAGCGKLKGKEENVLKTAQLEESLLEITGVRLCIDSNEEIGCIGESTTWKQGDVMSILVGNKSIAQDDIEIEYRIKDGTGQEVKAEKIKVKPNQQALFKNSFYIHSKAPPGKYHIVVTAYDPVVNIKDSKIDEFIVQEAVFYSKQVEEALQNLSKGRKAQEEKQQEEKTRITVMLEGHTEINTTYVVWHCKIPSGEPSVLFATYGNDPKMAMKKELPDAGWYRLFLIKNYVDYYLLDKKTVWINEKKSNSIALSSDRTDPGELLQSFYHAPYDYTEAIRKKLKERCF